MDTQKLLEERLSLFKNAINGKEKIKRIPHFANFWSWKFLDAGYTIEQALYDYQVMEKILKSFAEKYPVDLIYETGWRNPVQVTEVLGNDEYIFNNETSSISMKRDQCFMMDDEYDALCENPVKFLWEVFMPRKYKVLQKDDNANDFGNFLAEYGKFGGFMGNVTGMLIQEYGLPPLSDPQTPFDYWGNGYEILFCIMRGIKNLAMDIRRQPNKVKAAVDALDETFVTSRLNACKKYKGSCPSAAFDLNPVLLGQTILSAKQFEELYFPYLNRVFDYAADYEKVGYLFCEGENARFFDFFRDIQPGTFAIHSELNDIFEMKKRMPNLSMAGGMPVDLLGHATPQECVDYAKKLIDELGSEGKYIFSENKMVSFPYDCKSENLKAVSEFVFEYRI